MTEQIFPCSRSKSITLRASINTSLYGDTNDNTAGSVPPAMTHDNDYATMYYNLNTRCKGSFTVINIYEAYREYARGRGSGTTVRFFFFTENQHFICYH